MAGRSHPLHNLTADEICRATSIIKGVAQKEGLKSKLWFKSVSLQEPPKAILLPYLDAEAAGVSIAERPFVPCCLEVIWSYDNERKVIVSIVSLDTNTEVERNTPRPGQHSANDRSVQSSGR